jgi:hypothetical protein
MKTHNVDGNRLAVQQPLDFALASPLKIKATQVFEDPLLPDERDAAKVDQSLKVLSISN